jgi:hypothetical protein
MIPKYYYEYLNVLVFGMIAIIQLLSRQFYEHTINFKGREYPSQGPIYVLSKKSYKF